MALSISPQCCCGGPGIQRMFSNISGGVPLTGGFYIGQGDIGPEKKPCWASDSSDSPGNGLRTKHDTDLFGLPALLIGYSLLGYNRTNDSVIFATGFSHLYYATEFPDVPGTSPAIVEATLRGCNFGEGLLPWTKLISAADGVDIMNASVEDLDTESVAARCCWIGITDERIFGQSYWAGSPNKIFRVWSVAYDGSDLTIEVEISDSTVVPQHANVANGVIYSASSYPGHDVKIYVGASGSVMDGISTSTALQSLGAAAIGGQVLCLGHRVGSGTPTILTTLTGGGDAADTEIQLVITDGDDVEWTYTPIAISYDQSQRSVVVSWEAVSPFYSGALISYISGGLAPGNLIEQDHVKFYLLGSNATCGYINAFSFGGPDIGLASGFWAAVVEGKMPTPLVLEAGHLPSPDPIPADCGLFLDCSSETQAFFKLWGDGLAAHTDGPPSGDTIDGVGVSGESREFQDLILNIVLLDVAFLTDGVIPDDGGRPAAGLDAGSGSMKRYWGPIGTFGDYSDAGLMIFRDLFEQGPTYHREQWLCGIVVEVSCGDGEGVVSAVRLEWQGFKGHESASDPDQDWPPDSLDLSFTYLGTPLAQASGDDYLVLGVPSSCGMSGMLAQYEFDTIIATSPSLGARICFSFCQVELLT